jgi:hypothetical protein
MLSDRAWECGGMVDATDLKSVVHLDVRVRVSPLPSMATIKTEERVTAISVTLSSFAMVSVDA